MINASGKKKRVSKKKKSSWRKHVDISDVNNFLEEQRRDERIGNLSVVPNDDLFVLDTTPSTQTKLTGKQEKRLRLREAPLKCHSALKPLSNISDPIAKRNRVRTKEERQATMVRVMLEKKNREKGILRKREILSIAARKRNRELLIEKQRKKKFDFDKDIWSVDENELKNTPNIDVEVEKNQWLTGDAQRHLLHGTGKPMTEIPKSVKKITSVIKAVNLPHPGMSYNPSYEDHRTLLKAISDKEKEKIKQEEHLHRVTKDIFKRISSKQNTDNWMAEMSQGLPKPGEIDVAEEASDNEYKSVNPPVKNKKKTLQQRRKQREQVALELTRRKAKEEKKKIADIYKLKFIKRDLDEQKEKSKLLHERKLYAEERKKNEAKRLSVLKYEEPDLEFNMSQDISGNLRNMKSEGNLLLDRFKSMQKRNIIQPSIIRTQKRGKVKTVAKPGYKDDWMETIARPGFLKK